MYTFKRNDIVILLGAGASVEAKLPDSKEMIRRVEALVKDGKKWAKYSKLYNYVRSAIYYAKGINGEMEQQVLYNIEKLVETLDELAKREGHTLYPFVGAWNPRLLEVAGDNFDNVEKLRNEIVEVLRHEWAIITNYEDGNYYEGLVKFHQEFEHPLRVFTLNYDLAVEHAYKNIFHDYPERGFENKKWDWRLFDDVPDDRKKFFLYKLHGSLDWRNQDGSISYVDGPSKIQSDEIAIIFGTSYKLQYIDPFLFLAYEFRKWTLASKLIIVTGYGFGDDHINSIIRQALNSNSERKLLSVSPIPSGTEESQEINRIESSLKLSARNAGQVKYWNCGAREFMMSRLSTEKLGTLIPDVEPDIFPTQVHEVGATPVTGSLAP